MRNGAHGRLRLRAALLALLAAAGVLAAAPSPTALPNLPPSFDASTLVVVPASTAPVLDGNVDAVWSSAPAFEITAFGASGSFPQGAGIVVHALYNGTTLFMLVEWPDAAADYANAAWQLLDNRTAGGNWTRTTWGEDALEVILGNATGQEQNFSAAGCGPLCHTGAVDEMRTDMGTLDAWEWSSARSSLYGFADDLYLDNQSKVTGSPTGGFHGDGPDPFADNSVLTAYGDRPAFLNGSVPLNQSARFISNASKAALNWSTFNSSALPNGTLVPGFVLDPPAAGRADVGAAAVHAGGLWHLEMQRRLVTGDNASHDVPFLDLNATYFFSVAVTDNRTDENASHAGFVFKMIFAANVLPDLTPQAVTLAQPSTRIGDPVNLTVRVANVGFGNSTGPVFVAVVDGTSALEVANGTAPAITWGDSYLVNLSFPSGGYLPGAHNFTAAVDTANTTNESFEDNNTRAFQVTFVTVVAPADLVVESPSGPPGKVFAGEPFTVNGTVRNVGAGGSVLNVTVQAGHPLFGNRSSDLGPLAAGAFANFSLTFDSTGIVSGDYGFTLAADPMNLIAESNESNNTAAVLVSVESRPDLKADNFVADPATGLEGASLNLTLTVKNLGAGADVAFAVWLYLDDANSMTAVNRTAVFNLTANLSHGASVNFTQGWAIPSGLGYTTHLLRAWVDALGAVTEVDESNNNGTVQIGVLEPLTPDLTITRLTISSPSLRPGESASLTIEVANLGVDYGQSVRLEALDATLNRSLGNLTVAPVPAGLRATLTLNFTAPAGTPGIHSLLAIVDVDNVTYEGQGGELNNAFSISYTLRAPAVPDLAAIDARFDPPAPKAGDAVTLVLVVENIGDAPSPAFNVTFEWGASLLGTANVTALGPAQSYTAALVWDTTGVSGLSAIVTATIRLPEGSAEANLTNNVASLTLTFTPPGRASLHVEGATAAPAAVTQGAAVRLEATAFNNGTAAGVGAVLFLIDDVEVARVNVSLAPGESAVVNATWTAGAPGNHSVKAALSLNGIVVATSRASVSVAPAEAAAPGPPYAALALLALVVLVLVAFVALRRPKEPGGAHDPSSPGREPDAKVTKEEE